ncbi:hypothetical protein [Acidianus brierleyi]|uniref:Uncharacterized protein n=1 Tax=Acidianus brierleyi TaxID=41673 RepID=A0A2U9IB63_9CREN|nr:hypothetical protein [Acidianus brierleyi]AWR93234.1 hypothetical protein DFR85_00020 [Acidianus brierleyi]
MKLTGRLLLTILVVLFFIILSIPIDIFVSSAIGVENTTIISAALYIILASAAFFLVFFKDFY